MAVGGVESGGGGSREEARKGKRKEPSVLMVGNKDRGRTDPAEEGGERGDSHLPWCCCVHFIRPTTPGLALFDM